MPLPDQTTPNNPLFRPIPGTSLAVSRRGEIQDAGNPIFFDDYPHVIVPGRGGFWRLHVPAAVAMVWLDADMRGRIGVRANVQTALRSPNIQALAREYGLWPSAIAHVVRTPERDLACLHPIKEETWSSFPTDIVRRATVEGYDVELLEDYTPPVHGGNASVIHRHRIHIGSNTYDWLARGAGKWISPGDYADFTFSVTSEHRRKVIPWTVQVVNGDGQAVRRGKHWPEPNWTFPS